MTLLVTSVLASLPVLRAAEPEAETAAPQPPPPAEAPLVPRTAAEHRADPVAVAADALVVRPVGLAATVLGAAIFVVALPFAALSGSVKDTGRTLVGQPADFTFKRKLGDFE